MKINEVIVETQQVNEVFGGLLKLAPRLAKIFGRKPKDITPNYLKRAMHKVEGRLAVRDYYDQIDDYDVIARDYTEYVKMLDDPNLSQQDRQAVNFIIDVVGERRAALLPNRKGIN
jgi:glycogen debranching enzyme